MDNFKGENPESPEDILQKIPVHSSYAITETRPFKNVDRENANKWKMTLI